MPQFLLRGLSEPLLGQSFYLIEERLVVGRDPTADLVIRDSEVSRAHAVLQRREGEYTVRDLGSANGTFVDEEPVPADRDVPLRPGQRIRFGPVAVRFEERGEGMRRSDAATPVTLAGRTTIGRDAECDLVLAHPDVSGRHCVIERRGDRWFLRDLRSTNGTFVNGRLVDEAELREGDVVQIGLTRLTLQGGKLLPREQRGRMRIDARRVSREVTAGGRPLRLLRDLTFSIHPNELVAIVGGSGAGKSTLLKALNGVAPPTEGEVLYNAADFYAHLALFRSTIGYVPQDDIIHRELTVHGVLKYAARLRLPLDTSAAEVEALIARVLAELELTHRRDAVVSTLSGGERKRVNIAVELLTEPGVLFLDEPTSGLDPGLEKRVIALMRGLAEEGRTIVFVTHATESIAQCDMLLFLARGGQLAFFGPPQEALKFFEVSEFSDIYLQLNAPAEEENPWVERYRQSPYYERYVVGRQEDLSTAEVPVPGGAPLPRRVRISGARQLLTLTQRYAEVMARDSRNLLLLLAQAPVIAIILAMIHKTNIFTTEAAARVGEPQPIQDAAKLLFMLTIAALWFGTINAAREITKERPIYLRERLIHLKIGPYLLSKIAVLSLLCLVQSTLLLAIVRTRIDFHVGTVEMVQVWVTLVLASLCATLVGLAISAWAATSDQAMSIVPLVLLPQVVFSGLLIPLERMGFMRPVAAFMPSRWAFGALAQLCDLGARYRDAGASMFVVDVFDTSVGGGWVGLAVLGGIGLAAAWALLALRRET